MADVKIIKFVPTYNNQGSAKKKYSTETINHSFVRKPNMKNNDAVQLLLNKNLKELSTGLISEEYWTDSLSFVGFNTSGDKISSVSVGQNEIGNLEGNVKIISIDDFIDVYTHITANQIQNNPEYEKEYKKYFVNLMTYISQNRIRQ